LGLMGEKGSGKDGLRVGLAAEKLWLLFRVG